MHNKNWLKSSLAALFTISMLLGFVPHAWSTVTVTLTAPPNGSTVQGFTFVTANASAGQGYTVSKVEFFDGSTLIGTSTSAPYDVIWSNATSGSHTLTAKATAIKKNSANQTATTSPITVTFNKQPVVSLTTPPTPANNTNFTAPATITLSATASDSDGTIAKVDFVWSSENGDAGFIATVTQPPYTAVWTGVQPTYMIESGLVAAYTVSAVATDNQGGQGGAGVTVTVWPGTSPVTITSPADGTNYTAPATIPLAATVSSGLTFTGFYNGTTLIGSGSPFSWQNVGPGTYSLTARATDSNGGTWISTPITVTVTAASASALYFIHPDHLNTPRLITNQAQQAVWRWDHAEPFGTYPANENPSGLGAFEFNVRFPGQYFDKETNTHYNYFRDYDPAVGRYIQSDLIGLRGGINTYAYVGGNPLMHTDALGLSIWICTRAVDGPPFVGNHAYLWNDKTRKACSMRGSYGRGLPSDTEKGPGPGGDSCIEVPGSPGKEDSIIDCCKSTANNGQWFPGINDCHNAAEGCIAKSGLKSPGAPGGRLGDCNSCGKSPQVDAMGRALMNSFPGAF